MTDEITILMQAVQEAGEAILALQQKGLRISNKFNHDIVTQADLVANDILKTQLLTHFPHDGWLSEENLDDLQRLNCRRVWVVDPIDGTKEFALGLPEYAISVALIEKGMPILSAVFNPASNELFYAVKGKGAWLGQRQIHCCATDLAKNMLILVSRSEFARGEWIKLSTALTIKPMGSIAYKLALVAAGKAQATLSLGPKNEWDIAAGVLLITEALGKVTNKYQEKITFNQEMTKVHGILAAARKNYNHIFSYMHATGKC